MTEKTESRFVEIRAGGEGRTITGQAVPYGKETQIGGMVERFAQGSAQSTGSAVLNVGHDRNRPIAREPDSLRFEQRSDGLWFEAELPETREANDALANIRAGIYRGASIEFRAVKQASVSGVREVREAVIRGLAIVLDPAYRGEIQVRSQPEGRKRRIWL